MKRGDIYIRISEMLWKEDANVAAARKLPDWADFHKICGKHWLYFDLTVKEGRVYRTTTCTTERRGQPYGRMLFVAEGRGRTVVESIADAFAKSEGFVIPEAAAMLERGLAGLSADASDEPIDMEDILG